MQMLNRELRGIVLRVPERKDDILHCIQKYTA